jgi:thymidine kinase
MVTEGDVIVVGDVEDPAEPLPLGESSVPAGGAPMAGYEVLCRRHHRRRMTAAAARAAKHSPDVLPFD